MKLDWKIALGAIIVIVVAGGLAMLFLQPSYSYPEINSPRPFWGNPSASVIVQEFSDFQCPACANVFSLVKQLEQEFDQNVRFEFKQYPLTQIHKYAMDAALVSECANDQEKFWPYHDLLFNESRSAALQGATPNFSRENLIAFARKLDLNAESFTACLYSEAKKNVIEADIAQGDALRVPGTPTFFVNGVQVSDNSQLKNMILAALAQTSS
ncbi:MAG: thioredoxin domain-containing protein [Candidatus Diapherotrites archaeon]